MFRCWTSQRAWSTPSHWGPTCWTPSPCTKYPPMKPSNSLFFVTKLFCGSRSGFSSFHVDADADPSPAFHVPKLYFYTWLRLLEDTFSFHCKERKKEKQLTKFWKNLKKTKIIFRNFKRYPASPIRIYELKERILGFGKIMRFHSVPDPQH
jgi:hypothetical protein